MTWTMNSPQTTLEKGMLIRRPGLDESLEVVNVRNGQAKIKLPDGKTSTIPASAEVEWSWPASLPTVKGKKESGVYRTENDAPEEPESKSAANGETDSSGDWLTDWTLLDVGVKIKVLGEPGDFTILRLSDSTARIKHNATGQIQPLTIGHKFKIVDSGSGGKDGKTAGKVSKGKAKAGKQPAHKPVELPFDNPETQPDEISLDADEPSDEILSAIENGDDENENGDTDDTELDATSLEELDDDDDDTDDETDTKNDNNNNDDHDNDDKEDDEMPAPTPASNKSKKTPRSASTSLLTVGQISERTGISYPTLMRYIRDHGKRLPSEGEGRSRRFLPEAIDIFRQIRSETKGGRPSSGRAAGPRNPRKPRSDKGTTRADRPERSHETAAPYAAPARPQVKTAANKDYSRSQSVPSSTIDQALVSAIEHAQSQIAGLQALIDNLEAQRENLKFWS